MGAETLHTTWMQTWLDIHGSLSSMLFLMWEVLCSNLGKGENIRQNNIALKISYKIVALFTENYPSLSFRYFKAQKINF